MNDHKCRIPKFADKTQTWICPICKLTWNYEQGLYLVPDPNEKANWNKEPLIKKKMRESRARLLDQIKRNRF